ncbi:hsp70-binding protein 1 [Bombyx mori]|uniref:Nucleotide exchange factor Fes1 domain-containing protein n=1 Tax=Bombyx mori TaxID=7091 RepID=A0A8R1WLT9_BOMMO|nr:hsp70-binding protein 1 [Bombyx mori]
MSSNNTQNNTIAGALTYPTRSQDEVLPNQPRQPRNLQGLLRFAMEATKAEDAPGNSELGPIDDERRKFLEDALKSLTVNIAEVLLNAIRILTNTERIRSIQFGEPLPEDVQAAFDNVLEYIDDIDTANDFYKMGGFAMFPICYGSENEKVRALASTVLAELCQNNPFCQEKFLEYGLLNVLLTLVQSEQGEALVKCLYALSCGCREYSPACRSLVSRGGCGALGAALAQDEPSARTKAAFLIRYLASQYSDAKEQFIQHNVVRTIAEQLRGGRDATSEHFLNLLCTLLEDLDPRVLDQCRDPTLHLKETLEQHLGHPELESFTEEKEYCEEILRKVFVGHKPVEIVVEEADR